MVRNSWCLPKPFAHDNVRCNLKPKTLIEAHHFGVVFSNKERHFHTPFWSSQLSAACTMRRPTPSPRDVGRAATSQSRATMPPWQPQRTHPASTNRLFGGHRPPWKRPKNRGAGKPDVLCADRPGHGRIFRRVKNVENQEFATWTKDAKCLLDGLASSSSRWYVVKNGCGNHDVERGICEGQFRGVPCLE